MDRTQVILYTLGLAGVIGVSTLVPMDKTYISGSFYTGDIVTKIDYRGLYESNNQPVLTTSDYVKLDQKPLFDSLKPAVPLDTLAEIPLFSAKDWEEWQKDSNEYLKWGDETYYATLKFKTPVTIYAPGTGKITSVYPNIPSGDMPEFQNYFKGHGVSIEMLLNTKRHADELGDEYRLLIGHLDRTWQSFSAEEGFSEVNTGRTIYYTDFKQDSITSITKGVPIARTGRTGKPPDDDENFTYIYLKLEKKGKDKWENVSLLELKNLGGI